MTDTISRIRNLADGIDVETIAHAALQYAEASILTLSGVATDTRILSMAKRHEGMTDLLGTACLTFAGARSILQRVSDGASDDARVAYRMIDVAAAEVGTVLTTLGAWYIAAHLPGTMRDLKSLDVDPLATVERAMGRGFPLNEYVRMLDEGTSIERFLARR